jgi:NADH-quinone oxidoreductase subunit E
MLSKEEVNDIRAEREKYEEAQAAIPGALRIVQDAQRWISDENLCEISRVLDLTPEEVEAVATFYNLIFRRPVGRHVILICDSVSCWIMGYLSMRDTLTEKLGIALGETTSDGRFTLLPTACLGACDLAPVMMVDDDLHTLLTEEKIDGILAGYE